MKRSKHSLSHYKLLTAPMGKLVPVTWFEALPGDSIQQATSALIRCTPLLAPLMHPVDVRFHHWFVSNRLIWDDFEDFITGGEDGLDASVHPYVEYNGNQTSSIGNNRDYLGVPCEDYTGMNMKFNALPFRALALIYNTHYRDQQLNTELTIDTTSGQDTTTTTNASPALLNCSWQKDYFTTARTSEALGSTVTIPLLDQAPVTGIGAAAQSYPSSPSAYETDGTNPTYASGTSTISQALVYEEGATGYPNIYADLSASTGVAISDLRLALAIQRYQEARNTYGSRYVEYLRYLGVRSSDGRLGQPEYLGGGKQTIQFSEVLATDGSNTGTMKGHGIAAMRTNRYRRFFEEHGIVMTIMSVVPKSIYGNGIHRSWSRTEKEDYFTKELAHIGDQEVLNKEVYAVHASPNDTFGYQERYGEYREHPSGIAGDFRDQYDYWHMARIFASDPSLNSTFINCEPTTRCYAETTYDPLLIMTNHSIQARRMVPAVAKKLTF